MHISSTASQPKLCNQQPTTSLQRPPPSPPLGKMESMDYEMESPVAVQRGIHPVYALMERREQDRRLQEHQNYMAAQRHSLERINVDPLSAQHFYRSTDNTGGVPMPYEAGMNQGIHQNNAPMNPPNLPFFQPPSGARISDLEAMIAAHTRSVQQATNFTRQHSFRSSAAAGSTTYQNPPFYGRASIPMPAESNQMEYPQTSPPNWGFSPAASSTQYQTAALQMQSFRTQNYPSMPEFEYSASPAFHEQAAPSPGSGVASDTIPDPGPSTARFGGYQHTHPSTSYASMFASLETQNDINANIAQFRDTVIPGSGNSISGQYPRSDAEISAAIDIYFRTGEFQRVMGERLSNDEMADPGRPLQDFEAFFERLPRSTLQRQQNRPLWMEHRYGARERSPSGPSREINQANQARTRNADPLYVAHMPDAREQTQRNSYPLRRPAARAFERATVKAISGLQDVPIDSLSEEDRTCSICMDPFGEVEPTSGTCETPLKLPCGHIFGSACIRTWLKEHCTCPACRRKLESEIVHSHAPPHQARDRIRVANRLGAERTMPPQPSDSQRLLNASDRTARVRAPRRERDNAHNTTTNRYEGTTSRTYNTGPSDANYISENDITPTVHPRIGFTRSRSNAFSTRPFPSAARSLYSTLNDDSEVDHPHASNEGSARQQHRRRDVPPPFRTSPLTTRTSSAVEMPRRPVNPSNPVDHTQVNSRIVFGTTDARQHNNSNFPGNRFMTNMVVNPSAYPTSDSPTC
ncbi:hypothetical protein FGG08_001388 [Glutinoglossum americanum]|uniref:RING-type domain-containing protein n=1 Tax=Glutinoglossum americanum TaxID=1670608 RepID=A0A9P8IBE4_9PEZI|nr:hypothetical protein FGG08_001388 [Glutinoglossum americanum]